MTASGEISGEIGIRELDAAEAEARLDDLAELLVDAVRHGASVNFMAGFSVEDGRRFWRDQVDGVARDERRLFVGWTGDRVVATAVLTVAPQPNAPHRAEIGKMLVLSSVRRQGLGRRLLTAVEEAARAAGRTLLWLDTESGGAGDKLYRSCGWIPLGSVPDYAFRTDGSLAAATMFYKHLTAPAPFAPRGGA